VEGFVFRRKNACGNPKCHVSSFIDEETLTFGSGKLDEHGCWEYPCVICAAYIQEHPWKKVWPKVRLEVVGEAFLSRVEEKLVARERRRERTIKLGKGGKVLMKQVHIQGHGFRTRKKRERRNINARHTDGIFYSMLSSASA